MLVGAKEEDTKNKHPEVKLALLVEKQATLLATAAKPNVSFFRSQNVKPAKVSQKVGTVITIKSIRRNIIAALKAAIAIPAKKNVQLS